MQVAEHPVLAALRETLVAEGVETRTDGPAGPTPVLVTGAERRAAVATDPDASAGRPYGLYGNAFAAATTEVVRHATTAVEPPTKTNLIAMAAIAGGSGAYRADVIERILATAYTGFRAASLESMRLRPSSPRVAVHTGYWGCGAFGGNRVLMALLQALAARMAGIDRLVFHTGPVGGEEPLSAALHLLSDMSTRGDGSTADLLSAIEGERFRWGVSDGN